MQTQWCIKDLTIDLSADLGFLDGVVPPQMPVEDAIAVRQKVKQSLGLTGSTFAAASQPAAPETQAPDDEAAPPLTNQGLSLKLKQFETSGGGPAVNALPALPAKPAETSTKRNEEQVEKEHDEEEDRPSKMSKLDDSVQIPMQ